MILGGVLIVVELLAAAISFILMIIFGILGETEAFHTTTQIFLASIFLILALTFIWIIFGPLYF